jgi:hypothetical protein
MRADKLYEGYLAAKFTFTDITIPPAHQNREFSNVFQGNFLYEQGNYGSSARAGNVRFWQ